MRTCMPDQDHSLCFWCNKFSLGWPHRHPSQTSFPGWHLSGLQRGENLKVLSWGCRVDAVTPSIHLCDGFWSSDVCEALCYHAEATFHAASCQAKLVANASSFFFSACWLIYTSELIVFPLCITDYELDSPESNPGGDKIFRPSKPVLGPIQPPVKWVPGLSQG